MDINTNHLNKTELQQVFQERLEGLQRPPTLMCSNPTIAASKINCQQHEALACEQLNDITNVVHNIINELQSHIGNKEIRKQYEQCCSQTVREKNQID